MEAQIVFAPDVFLRAAFGKDKLPFGQVLICEICVFKCYHARSEGLLPPA